MQTGWLRGNVFRALLANVIAGACTWGVVSLLAHQPSPELLGRYSFAVALCTPLLLLTDLQLRAALATDRRQQYFFCDYLGLRVLTGVLLLPLLLSAALLLADRAAWPVIFLVGLVRLLDALADLVCGVFQQKEDLRPMARSICLRGVGGIGVFAALLTTTSLTWALCGMAAVRLLVLLLHDLPWSRRLLKTEGAAGLGTSIRPRFHGPTLTRLLGFSLPLGLVMMIYSLNANLPVLVLEGTWGEEAVAYYSALLVLTSIAGQLTGAVAQAVSPRLALCWLHADWSGFGWLLGRIQAAALGLGMVGVAAAWFIGEPVLGVLYGAAYGRFADVLVILAVGLVFENVGCFWGWGIIASRQYGVYAMSYVTTLIACGSASALLVPTYGIRGAAWSYVAAQATGAVAQAGSLLLLWRRASTPASPREAGSAARPPDLRFGDLHEGTPVSHASR